jgi:hypothetical protein
MKRFRKRDVGCWRNESGEVEDQLMEFENTEAVLDYIREKLPWTTNGDYELRTKDSIDPVTFDPRETVIYWTALGWIEKV